ncbi:MAG: hypothetical protein H5T84_07015 [Thermoleophilia bacterium]|nr:hypothetical protein [Thermoleophilia bacterium]
MSIMVEPGFITHPEEGPQLADPTVITQEALAIKQGIEAYLARA